MVLDLLLIAGFFLVLGGAEQVDLFHILALVTVLRKYSFFLLLVVIGKCCDRNTELFQDYLES